MKAPTVYDYTNYRDFLVAFAEHKKQEQPQWSYGQWARVLKLKSKTSISMVVNGKRHPGKKFTHALVNYFNFDPKETAYFLNLVEMAKSSNQFHLKTILQKEIINLASKRPLKLMDYNVFYLISKWYYLAIRQLARHSDFVANAQWIQNKLNFHVSIEDINQALTTMENLKLLIKGADGKVKSSSAGITTENDIAHEAYKIFHEQSIENSKSALRKFSVDQREFSAVTLPIQSKNLIKAKELIRRFIDDFDELLDDASGDQVYQLNVQLYPVADLNKASHDSGIKGKA